MEKKDYSHFGKLGQPGGLLLGIHGPDGLRQSLEHMFTELREYYGFPDTEEIRKVTAEFAKRKADEIFDNFRKQGVSEIFSTLFGFKKKRDLEKYCSELTIDSSKFACLVFNINTIGYNHSLKRRMFVPDYLDISEKELEHLFNQNTCPLDKNASKTAKKIEMIFKERKANHCHLFEKDDEWHMFYFSYAEAEEDSHWKGGPHIHFVNYLWPNLNKDELWKSFDNRRFKDPKSLHIKFNWGQEDNPV